VALLRTSSLVLGLGVLLAVPVAALLLDLDPQAALLRLASGLAAALDQVGWVLLPELVLAVGVVGLAIERVLRSAGGLAGAGSPAWLEPAIESALLLGMLGTLSGMVSGFAGLRADELAPAPLLHALGRALRSSLVGFSIALVGVWARHERTQVAT
jgi:hypothetical protein